MTTTEYCLRCNKPVRTLEGYSLITLCRECNIILRKFLYTKYSNRYEIDHLTNTQLVYLVLMELDWN